MNFDNEIKKQYFAYLTALVLPDYLERESYLYLLQTLYMHEYVPSIERDENRRQDGLELRKVFSEQCNFPIVYITNDLNEPCSLLEMMAALSNRIEDTIMYDPEYGNRISIWFKEMLSSLGIIDQVNSQFDQNYVEYCIKRFNNRQYDANGRGSLFTISDPYSDIHDCEIWYQMQSYISEYDRNNRVLM